MRSPAYTTALLRDLTSGERMYLEFNAPVNAVWLVDGMRTVRRVRADVFHALVRDGWVAERSDWGAFGSTFWKLTDRGRAAAEWTSGD